MRERSTDQIITAVEKMCVSANCFLNDDIKSALQRARQYERTDIARDMLCDILKNANIAQTEQMPICQDTGMVIVLCKIGQEVHISGGSLTDAINEGVRRGYMRNYLRLSVVGDPLRRENTGDNTPAVIYYDVVSGDTMEITLMPKGFGSENMSAVAMLKPSQGRQGVVDFVLETVKRGGSNPCPPIVVGVGIGGTMDKAALLSKQALTRRVDSQHDDPYYAQMEQELLDQINALDIGVQGFGGKTTALGVNIETFPTHIAGLPVAVTISCHVTRHAHVIL